MITYNRTAFGVNLLFRIHGSAVYRAILPSVCAVGFFFMFQNVRDRNPSYAGDEVEHPYAIGVLVASITFLIVFRANHGYGRYWEGAGAVHHMMSKWMDATSHSGMYHLQCDHYKDIKPPSYFDHPEFNDLYLTRDRERGFENSILADSLRPEPRDMLLRKRRGHQHRAHKKEMYEQKIRSVTKSINYVEDDKKRTEVIGRSKSEETLEHIGQANYFQSYDPRTSGDITHTRPMPMLGRPRIDGNWGPLFKDKDVSIFMDPKNPDHRDGKGFASIQGGRTPPLFLQELAHLSSLLVAVALSTLRNDIDGAESPLAFYEPGKDWPDVDPDKDLWLKTTGFTRYMRRIAAFLGMGRSPKEQTAYNAGRPLPVIGGVSEGEIRFLQRARGPYAKTQLCWNWLSEFIIREHLAGSMGKVGPPIISRVIQFLGDGMIHYNHARKIMFIPFPFVHAQLSVLFVFSLVVSIPFLMDQYTEHSLIGSLLTFFTVLCLSGIHEVARELENPFRNVPNELPLVTFQAQYNEALFTMYSGYHPDQFWDGKRVIRKRREQFSEPLSPAGSNDSVSSMPTQDEVDNNRGEQTSSIPSASPERAPTEQEQIASLQRQLTEQAKIIEALGRRVNGAMSTESAPSDISNQVEETSLGSNGRTPT